MEPPIDAARIHRIERAPWAFSAFPLSVCPDVSITLWLAESDADIQSPLKIVNCWLWGQPARHSSVSLSSFPLNKTVPGSHNISEQIDRTMFPSSTSEFVESHLELVSEYFRGDKRLKIRRTNSFTSNYHVYSLLFVVGKAASGKGQIRFVDIIYSSYLLWHALKNNAHVFLLLTKMVTPIIRLSTYRSTIRDNKKFVCSKSIILIQFVQSERNLVKRNIVSIRM